jgi:hypothetical protein
MPFQYTCRSHFGSSAISAQRRIEQAFEAMAAPDVICKPPDQMAEGMLHKSLVSVGGEKIAEGTWHRSCKMFNLVKIAHRSKPGLDIKLFYGSSKLNPQMFLTFWIKNWGACH